MKKLNLDLKSIIIGMLSMTLIFILLGNRNQTNLGDIVVTSLAVEKNGNKIVLLGSDENGGYIALLNSKGKCTTSIFNNGDKDGVFTQFNSSEIPILFLGNVNGSGYIHVKNSLDKTMFSIEPDLSMGGKLKVYNHMESVIAEIGVVKNFGGTMMFYNADHKCVSYIGTDTDEKGLVAIFDKSGVPKWYRNADSE
jgi:hypothetical protein